jgi:hypothetical protein
MGRHRHLEETRKVLRGVEQPVNHLVIAGDIRE